MLVERPSEITPAALIELALDLARELVAETGSAHVAREIEATELQPFGWSLHLLADAAEGIARNRVGEPKRWHRARAAAAAARLAAHLQTLNQFEEMPRG